MDDLNKYTEMIPEYILGRLNSDEQAAFEEHLKQGPELREELLSHRRLQSGLKLYERMSADHVPSDLLSAYAVNPESLDKSDLDRVKEHLAKCPACREDFLLCSVPKEVPAPVKAAGPLTSLMRWLLSPAVQPIMVAALLAMVLIPTLYFGFRDTPTPGGSVTFAITPVSRNVRSINHLAIPDNAGSINLQFFLPVPESATVECVLIDEAGTVVHEWEYDGAHNPFDLELSTDYLDSGIYSLRIRELGSNVEDNWFVFRLRVTLD